MERKELKTKGDETKRKWLIASVVVAFGVEGLFVLLLGHVSYHLNLNVILETFICATAIAIDAVFVYFTIRRLYKIKRSFCPNCHTQYDYDEDITWKSSASGFVKFGFRCSQLYYDLKCLCHCCGKESCQYERRNILRGKKQMSYLQHQIAKKIYVK